MGDDVDEWKGWSPKMGWQALADRVERLELMLGLIFLALLGHLLFWVATMVVKGMMA